MRAGAEGGASRGVTRRVGYWCRKQIKGKRAGEIDKWQGRAGQGRSGQGRAGQEMAGMKRQVADLQQPDLPAVIHHQIKPKELKAVGQSEECQLATHSIDALTCMPTQSLASFTNYCYQYCVNYVNYYVNYVRSTFFVYIIKSLTY